MNPQRDDSPELKGASPRSAEPDDFTPAADNDGTDASNNIDSSISRRFEIVAEKYPDREAVVCANEFYSYDCLNKAANRVARTILTFGDHIGDTVAVLFDHEYSLVVAVLGVLKAGKTYVPLSLSFPEARTRLMLDESRAKLILTNSKGSTLAHGLSGEADLVLNIEEVGGRPCDSNPLASMDLDDSNLEIDVSPGSTAYILFSSGSTGVPKGIVQSHRNVLHHLGDNASSFQLTKDDRHAFALSYAYAASVSELLGPLVTGATTCFFDFHREGLATFVPWLRRREISILKLPISVFRMLLRVIDGPVNCPHLRYIILGGDALFSVDVTRSRKVFPPDCVLVNRLTSTEANTLAQFVITPDTDLTGSVVPVGKPARDKQIEILDDAGKPAGLNTAGEIVVTSRFLTPGYLNRSDLNESAFSRLPSAGTVTTFRTGDLGRFRGDGILEHMGRKDDQVKIRGFRVEIPEITATLLSMTDVDDAAVIAPADASGNRSLRAYVVPSRGSVVSTDVCRTVLCASLPDYMIPSSITLIPKLPRTPTGKLDREALSSYVDDVPTETEYYLAPRNDLELRLQSLWQITLKTEKAGVTTRFSDCGGDSMSALQMSYEIEKQFGKRLPLTSFHSAASIESVAVEIQSRTECSTASILVPMQTEGDLPPFFCVPPAASTALVYQDLVRHLGNEQRFYSFQHQGMYPGSRAQTNVRRIAKDYLREVRLVQPEGPYFLGGMCFGGTIALEMADQLTRMSETTAIVTIFDTKFPPQLKTGTHVSFRRFNRKHLKNVLGLFICENIGLFALTSLLMKLMPSRNHARVLGPFRAPENCVRKTKFAHRIARRNYMTPPSSCRISYFMCEETRSNKRLDAWERFAVAGFEIIPVPGRHDKHDKPFHLDPYAAILAEKLNIELKHAREKSLENPSI